MGLIKSSQETDGVIFKHVHIGEYYWTRLNMSRDFLRNINQKTNTNTYMYHQILTIYTNN